SRHSHTLSFLSTAPPPPPSTLFPYTTLFRSNHRDAVASEVAQRLVVGGQKIESVKADRARDLGGPFRQQAHDGETVRRGLGRDRSEEHTSELQSLTHLVCRLLLEKKKKNKSR